MANIFHQRIVPEKPKVIEESQIYVYVPSAEGDNKGIASFNQRDFSSPRGRVSLKWPMEMMVNKLANPLTQPAMTKLLTDEFTNTGQEVALTNPVTKTKYTSNTAEVKLNRSFRNALNRPDLVMLDSGDFKEVTEGTYHKYKIKAKDPTFSHTIVKVDEDDFNYDGDKINVKWPLSHNGGFGLVKVRNDGSGNLSFDNDNYLRLDEEKFKENFEDYLAFRPSYGGNWVGKEDLVDPVTKLAKRNAAGQTLLKIDKESVGLDKLVNRGFESWTYGDFGPSMKNYFETQFDSKLDEVRWELLFSDWIALSPNEDTVQKRFAELESSNQSLWDSIRSSNKMLGYYVNLTELEAKYPATSELTGYIAYLLSTSSYWMVIGTTWTNTGIEHNDLYSSMELDATIIKPNAKGSIGSVGTSGKLLSSDHEHPSDPNKLNVEVYENIKLNINEFTGTLVDNQITLNLPYVNVSKYLHNWKDNLYEFTPDPNSEEKYWAGSRAEFEALDLESIPTNMLMYIRDEHDEELVPGTIITKEELDQKGLPVDSYNLLVTVTNNHSLQGKLLTLVDKEPIPNVRGPRRELVELIINNTDTSQNYKLATIRNNKLEQLSLAPNKILTTDNQGNIKTTLTNDGLVVKGDLYDTGTLALIGNDGRLESFYTGFDINRPIVSDGNNKAKPMTSFTPYRLLEFNANGGLVNTELVSDNVLKTSGNSTNHMDYGKVIISNYTNIVDTWIPANYEEGSLVVAGPTQGSIKLRGNIATDRIMLSDENGKLKEMSEGDPLQILALNSSKKPVWINNPVTNGHLAQTVLTANPTLTEALNFNGLVAVVLGAMPPTSQMWSNCIYYIG